MKLSSSAFEDSGKIPTKYTCEGQDISPPLTFADIPPNAKSLVLIMDDPDVPASIRKEQMWDHWVVYDMPPTTKALAESATPPGVLGKNTGGGLGYSGPCPPDREHRYFFKLYALDTLLKLSPGASKAQVEKAMEGHIIESTKLMGRYNKIKK